MFLTNNNSAIKEELFVLSEIEDLLATGRVLEVQNQPHIVSPFSVSYNGDGSLRLILDLSTVNTYIFRDKIKFDDWKVMEEYVQRGDFLYKFDISKGYHHIDIWSGHFTYLGFSWSINGQRRFFVFTVLPFGITSGPFVFTKVMRGLVKHWRFLGIKIACFLDDGLGTASKNTIAKAESKMVHSTLLSAGFIINEEKSCWIPSTKITWLGVTFNSVTFNFKISDKRTVSLLGSLEQTLSLPTTTPRKLAKVCGKLISTQYVLGYIVQLKTRRLFTAINQGQKWDSKICLKSYPKAVAELKFWKQKFTTMNIRYISKSFSPAASNTGLASKVYIEGHVHTVYKNFSRLESKLSSTWRELFAVYYSILSLSPLLTGRILVWPTDNFAASKIFVKGSNKSDLQLLSENIFEICRLWRIKASIRWIPRLLLKDVDGLRRKIDYDDWEVTQPFSTF